MFKGIVIEKDDSRYRAGLREIDESELPGGNVVVRIHYSALNYKDALAITGKSPVVRLFPMVPGIDLVGAVEESSHLGCRVGDTVILNGWGVGESHWGGLAEMARVNGDWLVPLPKAITEYQAMAIGTAGFTAMLCVLALEWNGVTPDRGEVLVTGASGGVGGVAIALLSKLGYRVVAVTGRPEESDYIKCLGAAEVLSRSSFSSPGKPLGKERWAGAVDVIGSHVLANICATTKYGGTVAACGLAGAMEFPATVAPFILRGVTLAGIDSVMCPRDRRLEVWRRLGRDLDMDKLKMMTKTIGLAETLIYAHRLLSGALRGRTVVAIAQ